MRWAAVSSHTKNSLGPYRRVYVGALTELGLSFSWDVTACHKNGLCMEADYVEHVARRKACQFPRIGLPCVKSQAQDPPTNCVSQFHSKAWHFKKWCFIWLLLAWTLHWEWHAYYIPYLVPLDIAGIAFCRHFLPAGQCRVADTISCVNLYWGKLVVMRTAPSGSTLQRILPLHPLCK